LLRRSEADLPLFRCPCQSHLYSFPPCARPLRVRSEQRRALSPKDSGAPTHTHARARRGGRLTGPSTKGERGEQQPFLVCVESERGIAEVASGA
jgi:hypothetical protein